MRGEKVGVVALSSVYGLLASLPWLAYKTLLSSLKGALKGAEYGMIGIFLGPAVLITEPVFIIVGTGMGALYGLGSSLSVSFNSIYAASDIAYHNEK